MSTTPQLSSEGPHPAVPSTAVSFSHQSESNTTASNNLNDPRVNSAIVRKYDIRIMPVAFFGLLVFWLDRSNIALARINGMEDELGLRGPQFNLVIMIFSITYVIFTIPGNLVMRHIGGRVWLPSLMAAWGIVTLCTGFVRTFAQLCVTRVFLGIAESGFLCGVLLYLGFFYTSDELTARFGVFFSSTPLAGSVGGLLAGALSRIEFGGFNRWPWIFIIEGIITVLLGIASFWILPDTPATAAFLSDDERTVAVGRMHIQDQKLFAKTIRPAESMTAIVTRSEKDIITSTPSSASMPIPSTAHTPQDKLNSTAFRSAICHPITIFITIGAFFSISALYSYTIFLPTIIDSMREDYTPLQATLLTVPPNFVGFLFTIAATQWSQRTCRFAIPLIGASLLAALGYTLILTGSHAGSPMLPSLQYTGTFLVSMGVHALPPLAMAWTAINASPHFVRAIALGFMNMLGNFGGIAASFTYIKTQGPQYTAGHSVNLGFLVALIVVGIVVLAYIRWENAKRDRGERDYRLDEANWTGKNMTREQYEIQLGWKHPLFRYHM